VQWTSVAQENSAWSQTFSLPNVSRWLAVNVGQLAIQRSSMQHASSQFQQSNDDMNRFTSAWTKTAFLEWRLPAWWHLHLSHNLSSASCLAQWPETDMTSFETAAGVTDSESQPADRLHDLTLLRPHRVHGWFSLAGVSASNSHQCLDAVGRQQQHPTPKNCPLSAKWRRETGSNCLIKVCLENGC